jgi:hypothetical protein
MRPANSYYSAAIQEQQDMIPVLRIACAAAAGGLSGLLTLLILSALGL